MLVNSGPGCSKYENGRTWLDCACDFVSKTGCLLASNLGVRLLGLRGDLLSDLLAESFAAWVGQLG